MRAGLSEWQRVERIFRDIERGNQLILRAAGEGRALLRSFTSSLTGCLQIRTFMGEKRVFFEGEL